MCWCVQNFSLTAHRLHHFSQTRRIRVLSTKCSLVNPLFCVRFQQNHSGLVVGSVSSMASFLSLLISVPSSSSLATLVAVISLQKSPLLLAHFPPSAQVWASKSSSTTVHPLMPTSQSASAPSRLAQCLLTISRTHSISCSVN